MRNPFKKDTSLLIVFRMEFMSGVSSIKHMRVVAIHTTRILAEDPEPKAIKSIFKIVHYEKFY